MSPRSAMLNQKFSFYALFRRYHLLHRHAHALANDTRYYDFPIVALPPFLRWGLGVPRGAQEESSMPDC
jgi:hypothetical protein